MRARFALPLLALAGISVVPAAHTATPAAPTGLRGFLLRADEPVQDTFPRTPSFGWAPYTRATSYDFEIATSKAFEDSEIVWSTGSRKTPLRVPALAIPVTLPWMTGSPYALYAHVRAHTASGVTKWSTPFGFNMRWKTAPEQMLPTMPGLVRWKPVEGATSYEVWFVDVGKVFTTSTNVADEREYYTFHQDPQWTGTVQWRVRAVRKLYGNGLPNGLPIVSVGPWSPTFVSANPTVSTGPMALLESASDVVGSQAAPVAHSLTPAFVYAGDTATNGLTGSLYRVYVATDKQCVNIVFTGSVVGSPAYAPRTTGSLTLPTTAAAVTTAQTSYLADGAQTGTFTADLRTVTTTETSATGTATDDDRGQHDSGDHASVRLHRHGRPRRPLGQRLADRPLLLDGRPGPGGHDDDRRPVLRRRGAAGRLRGRPRRRVRQDEPAGDHIADVEAVRLGPLAERRTGRRPVRHPLVLPCGARRLGTGARRDRLRGAVVEDEVPVEDRVDDAVLHRSDVPPAGGTRHGHLVLPGAGHRPVHPRAGEADDLVEPRADQADQADVHRPGRVGHDPPGQEVESSRSSFWRRRKRTPPKRNAPSTKNGAPTIST